MSIIGASRSTIWTMSAYGAPRYYGLEFGAKFDANISMSTNTFYMFYIGLGFFHFMHVVLGMVILGDLFSLPLGHAADQIEKQPPGG